MTNEILQKVAKQHKINLEHFDEVLASINEKYTWVYITFASRENVGGTARHCGETSFKLSVFSIQQRGEDETEYATNGWEWISDIKNRRAE